MIEQAGDVLDAIEAEIMDEIPSEELTLPWEMQVEAWAKIVDWPDE